MKGLLVIAGVALVLVEPLAPPSLGPLLARVQIVEFFDPACEACRVFYPHVKQILQDNAGTRLVLRYAPFHQGSEYVIRVLEAARMQGEDLYIERAKRDMNDPRITGLNRKDTADIVSLNMQRTPTFFVNDKPLREMSPRGLAMQVAQELAPD